MTSGMIFAVVIGYLLGSFQSAYLLGKVIGRIDIREHGSGNAGASNITTILGLGPGVVVGLIDLLKGALAVWILTWIYPTSPELSFLSGLTAVLGHMFPFYLKFRGGKGVATLVGMMFGVDWKLGLLSVLLVAGPAFLSDYIVAGSFSAFLALPVVTYLRGLPTYLVLLSLALTLICFLLHRGNVQRILAGEELKISSVLFKQQDSA